jgi:NADH dehydrogenase
MSEQRKKIVVIGGGFAGMNFVKSVCHFTEYDITLVDKHNFHQFMPLLYQVAMAFIEPSNISYPFRRMFQRQKNIHFHFGCVQSVDVASNTIQTDTGTISFDYLVIATGTVPNYFGMENVKKNSFPLKSITDATNLRNHLLMNIEEAVTTSDPEQRAALLKVVIAGGGPTGVEVAGMLAEMVRNIGPKEYPEFTTGSFRIYLIEAAPVLLGTMSEKAQQEALHTLSSLGVTIQLNTAVKDFIDGKVILSSGESIATRALVWTSGVTGGQLDGLDPEKFGRGRRLVVD